jgi:PiT family inorganic phosphate transporter
VGFLLMVAVTWIFRRWHPFRLDQLFRRLQLVSAGLYSLGHGGNDAQKTIGVIWAVMIAGGVLPADSPHVPYWVIVASYSAMAIGTAVGGQRIIKTMGMGITSLKPVGGFCANLAGAITLFGATHLKIPVSTTHTITGAIVGVGSVTKVRGIRWGLATRIVWAWIFTIPLAGAVGAGSLYLARAFNAF